MSNKKGTAAGVAMCWENMRYDTVRRMQGKVDFIVGGSCWWDLCESDGAEAAKLRDFSAEQAVIAPIHVAELIGVPFIHASHHAQFEYSLLSGEKRFRPDGLWVQHRLLTAMEKFLPGGCMMKTRKSSTLR